MDIKLETLLARISDFNSLKDAYGASHLPIYQTATFDLKKQTGDRIYDYSRTDNPTRNALEDIFTKAENGDGCTCTNTGIASIALLFDSVVKAGDSIIVEKDCYGGTFRILNILKENHAINVEFADFCDLNAVEEILKKKNIKLLLCESPTNPGLKIIDLAAVSVLCKKYGTLFAVDNSMATFASQKPLDLGADFSIFSATKYVSGHGSVISGAVVTKEEKWTKAVKFYSNAGGRAQSPFECFLVSLGLPTLTYRLKAHEASATKIAEYLSKRNDVLHISFPKLKSHPQYELANKQMKICPGLITLDMTTVEKAHKFVNNTKLFGEKASFGCSDSRVEMPAKISHASYSEEDLKAIGISKSTLRLSIGLEDTDDLINDIDSALE